MREMRLMINYYSKMLASEHEGKRRGGTFFILHVHIQCNVQIACTKIRLF